MSKHDPQQFRIKALTTPFVVPRRLAINRFGCNLRLGRNINFGEDCV